MRHLPTLALLALLPLNPALAATPAARPSSPAAAAAEPIVQEVMTRALPEYPGKEALILTVTYPPGGADPVHRHDAHGFVYVLEGRIVMGVAGGPEVTLGPGEAFHEGPRDLHTVGRNASQTDPARFVVFLIKDADKPAVLPPH